MQGGFFFGTNLAYYFLKTDAPKRVQKEDGAPSAIHLAPGMEMLDKIRRKS